MEKQEINVYIEQEFRVSLRENWLRNIVKEVLDAESIMLPVEIGLVVTNSETIQQLNKAYRGKDEPTDVLAFPMSSYAEQEDESVFITPPDNIPHLGEVVISYPQVVQQSGDHGHGVNKELALVAIHGMLHLLGYDHGQPEERQCMRAREREILKKLDFTEGE